MKKKKEIDVIVEEREDEIKEPSSKQIKKPIAKKAKIKKTKKRLCRLDNIERYEDLGYTVMKDQSKRSDNMIWMEKKN